MARFMSMLWALPGAETGQTQARLVAVVGKGVLSRLSRDIAVTSEAVMQHMAVRLSYADPGFKLHVFTDADLQVLSRPCVGGLLQFAMGANPSAPWSCHAFTCHVCITLSRTAAPKIRVFSTLLCSAAREVL